MKSLICPISTERIDETVVRITAFITAAMIALYATTGIVYFILLVAADYVVRVFTPLKYSPISWLACQIARRLDLPKEEIDKAPKIFAARVGFLFALTAVVLYFVHPTSSVIVGLALMGFNLLDALFGFCVGCITYTYIVYPLWGK